MLASDPDDLAGDVVEASVLEKSAKAKENYHIFGTLDGVLTEKSYISVHEMRSESGECTGYLFLCSSGDRLVEFRKEFFSNFFLSACLMLLVASVLTKVMMHKLTDPIQKVTDAAQRFGGGDLSVRVEGVDGEGEVADLARTFNQMADNIQSNDNSRGQFMGNIAHELRTPMTTIKASSTAFWTAPSRPICRTTTYSWSARRRAVWRASSRICWTSRSWRAANIR